LRLIEEPAEFARVRRLHPQADEELLRALRDDLENRFAGASEFFPGNGQDADKAPGSRGVVRSYCARVLKQARLWERMQKGVRAEEFTFPGDPMRLDYGYRRNGTRGFVQALSVTRAPADAKLLTYTVGRIRNKVESSEFTAVTDVALLAENERHRFVRDTLRDADVEAVAMEGFAVWTAKKRPMIQ
jgi:hypothetical protein